MNRFEGLSGDSEKITINDTLREEIERAVEAKNLGRELTTLNEKLPGLSEDEVLKAKTIVGESIDDESWSDLIDGLERARESAEYFTLFRLAKMMKTFFPDRARELLGDSDRDHILELLQRAKETRAPHFEDMKKDFEYLFPVEDKDAKEN